MAKKHSTFVCKACGAFQSRWMGKCPDCGTWDSLQEQRIDAAAARDPQRGTVEGWTFEPGTDDSARPSNEAIPISHIRGGEAPDRRLCTGISELDRVLGGGLVPASAVLVGGDPGIGKSTLMMQSAARLAGGGTRVLYVSSEESAQQVSLRAARLGVVGQPAEPGRTGTVNGAGERFFVLADTNLSRIVEQTRRVRPDVLVIDSVQMVYKADLGASPGSITQLRACCAELICLAKISGIAVILVGHVTKDGQLAGPRLLEHLVDAVLYFEGDRYHAHRVVRAVKNRFGGTLEIGIFEMTGQGLMEAPDGLGIGAGTIESTARPGTAACPVISGSRCVLVEIQALTATGFLGAAKRKSSGLDPNRLAMIIAVLEQHAGLRLADRDVFASSVGGLRVGEPASDLALLLAVASAHLRRPLPPATAVVGEVGLSGEVRPVGLLEQRTSESSRLGFRRIIVPRPPTAARTPGEAKTSAGAEVIRVGSVQEAIEQLG